MAFVIEYHPSHVDRYGRPRFVRVYQNGKTWVDRLHAKTATPFLTEAEAYAVIVKFALPFAKVVGQ